MEHSPLYSVLVVTLWAKNRDELVVPAAANGNDAESCVDNKFTSSRAIGCVVEAVPLGGPVEERGFSMEVGFWLRGSAGRNLVLPFSNIRIYSMHFS